MNSNNTTLTPPPTPQVSVPQVPPTPSTQVPSIQRPQPSADGYTFTNIPPIDLESNHDQSITQQHQHNGLVRAGLNPKPRLILMTSIGSFWGFSMGAFLGARQSGLQYLAENAHKLPTTVQGWYFYHKTKNYRMMLGGVKKGIRFAGKTGGLCLLYGALEASLDDVRGEADVMNSVTAGIATGTIFSALSKLGLGFDRVSFRVTNKRVFFFFFFFLQQQN
jgi:hypothetical protein